METYIVFVIQAHNGESPDGHLTDYTEMQLIDDSVEGAMKRAKKMVDKKFYRLATIIEKQEGN